MTCMNSTHSCKVKMWFVVSSNAIIHHLGHTRTHRHTDASTQCMQSHLSRGKVANDDIPLPNKMDDLQVLCSGHGESSGILKPGVHVSDVDEQVLGLIQPGTASQDQFKPVSAAVT